MEMVLNNGFSEMTKDEIIELEGGGWIAGIGATALAAFAIISGPPAWITGSVAVGAWYVSATAVGAAGIASIFE